MRNEPHEHVAHDPDPLKAVSGKTPAASPGGDRREEQDLGQLRAERDRLRAERDRLQSEVAGPKKARRRRARRGLVGVLVGLSALLITLSTFVFWTHRTVLNTNTFVSTVTPIFKDPVVVDNVSTRATAQLFDQLDVESRLQNALPERATFVARPITNRAEAFVSSQLSKVMLSEQFQALWDETLAFTHSQVVAVLRGESTPVLSTTGGTIVINTVPLINEALGQVSGLASELVGKPVTLPTISSAELPPAAVDKLSSALGVQLPSDFGQITLVHSSQLSTVQRAVTAFDRLAIFLPIITLAIAALALLLSLSRRRSLLQLVVASMLVLIVARRVVIYFQAKVVGGARSPEVADHVLGQLLHGFYALTATMLWVGLAIVALALVTGPYRWARWSRHEVADGARSVGSYFDHRHRSEAWEWVTSHAAVLQFAGAVLGAILLLVVSVSWLSFLLIGVLLAAYEVGLQSVKAQPAEPEKPTGLPEEASDSAA